jgi:hypothetical protein
VTGDAGEPPRGVGIGIGPRVWGRGRAGASASGGAGRAASASAGGEGGGGQAGRREEADAAAVVRMIGDTRAYLAVARCGAGEGTWKATRDADRQAERREAIAVSEGFRSANTPFVGG